MKLSKTSKEQKMERLVMVAVAAAGLLAAANVEIPDPTVRELSKQEVMALPKEARMAYMQRLIALKTGGRIVKPNTGKGAVRVISSTKAIGAGAMDETFAVLTKVVKIDIKMIEGTKPELLTAKGELKKYDAQAGVFVVEDEALPRLLVAPEEGWAIVNVTALKEGNVQKEKFEARIRKEISRALALVAGCGNAGAVMQSVTKVSDLDNIPVETFPPTARNQMIGHLGNLGIEPIHEASYLRACQEGWAPSPTNDAQRAIWKKVKSDRERGPTNPITIPPPNKKK